MEVFSGSNFSLKVVPQLMDVNQREFGGLKIEGKDRTKVVAKSNV
jgi:hypothetical protein